MLLSVKRVSSRLPEAKQSIPEKGSGCHRTTGDIPLHISLHISERCPTSLRNSWEEHQKSSNIHAIYYDAVIVEAADRVLQMHDGRIVAG